MFSNNKLKDPYLSFQRNSKYIACSKINHYFCLHLLSLVDFGTDGTQWASKTLTIRSFISTSSIYIQ